MWVHQLGRQKPAGPVGPTCSLGLADRATSDCRSALCCLWPLPTPEVLSPQQQGNLTGRDPAWSL